MFSDGRTISYEYDAEDRITKVIDSVDGTTTYTYDVLGQLLTEVKDGTVVNTMTYDNYGNILVKNGKTYTYGDSVWKDRLTAYDGQTITYDAQGNPTTYLGHTLTWEKGRQLKSFDTNTYTYNVNGIRTSKTIEGVKHTYTLDGAKILRETWGANSLVPMYDNEDTVCGIIYNDVPYYFFKNLQGDVIAITDANATVVARYSYDAWGVTTITSDTSGCSISAINPYRYRSYYYDVEIHMYYLQSRYYNPIIDRFLNADEEKTIVLAGEQFFGNLFVYCNNDPIDNADDIGLLSFNSIKKSIRNLISKLFNKFIDYITNLVTYKDRFFTIKTVVISATIDSVLFVLGGIANFVTKKALFKIVKSILFKNKQTTTSFMKWFIDLWETINVVRFVLWAVSLCAGKHVTKIKSYLSDFSQELIGAKSKIANLYFDIISLTSFSGIVAFLLDLTDGECDEQIKIRV